MAGEHIDSELLPFVKHFNADYNFLRSVPASFFLLEYSENLLR